jgi:hypothetical protein
MSCRFKLDARLAGFRPNGHIITFPCAADPQQAASFNIKDCSPRSLLPSSVAVHIAGFPVIFAL